MAGRDDREGEGLVADTDIDIMGEGEFSGDLTGDVDFHTEVGAHTWNSHS